jgi:hypothetical protein
MEHHREAGWDRGEVIVPAARIVLRGFLFIILAVKHS